MTGTRFQRCGQDRKAVVFVQRENRIVIFVRGDVLHLRTGITVSIIDILCRESVESYSATKKYRDQGKPHRLIVMRDSAGEQITAVLWPEGHCTSDIAQKSKTPAGAGVC
jgi:hypothetical protein